MTIRALLRHATDAAPPQRLGSTRVLVGAYTLAYLAKRRGRYRAIVRTDETEFTPVGPVRVLSRPLRPEVADALNDATLATSALFTLGVSHRVVGPLHSALLTWTQSYRNSWGMIYHTTNTAVAQTAVLGLTRAADAVSLPTLGRPAPPAHARYGVALNLMNLGPALAYLLAGIAKLAQPRGWTWVRGDGLRRHVAINAVRKGLYGLPPGEAGTAIYPYRRLWTAAAVGSLVLEFAAPLVLLDRRLGRLWATAMFGLHWGIKVVMRIDFTYQMFGISFAPWFDLERLPGLVARLFRR